MTPHNSAKKNEIAKTVIMPGDPKRATYIAQNFLKDAKLVNDVRLAYCYTGKYKGKKISVMASGMGIPSMGIYSYELFSKYDVDNILRIGSCGAKKEDLKLFDIILSNKVYSESNYSYTLNNDNCHLVDSSKKLNDIILNTANKLGLDLKFGDTLCTDCFDLYMTDVDEFDKRVPKISDFLACEMEAFALFYNAKLLNKNAATLMSVVDSKYIKDVATIAQREQGLNNMIKLALESAITF